MTPVAASIVRPAGRPLALKASVSPSASLNTPAVAIDTDWASLAVSVDSVPTVVGPLLGIAATVQVKVVLALPPLPSAALSVTL